MDFIKYETQLKPHYKTVWSGRANPKESDVVESASVSTVEFATEEIQLHGLNAQDNDDTNSDFFSPNSSLTHCPSFNTQSFEEDSTLMINVEESEVQMSVEEKRKETNNVSVVTKEPTECEDTSLDASVALVIPKAGKKQ